MTDAAGYTLEVLRDPAALEHCAEEWRALPQARSSPLLCPEWGLAALPALHAHSHVLALRMQGALAALAPLARQQRAGIERIEFLGAARLHEPTGFLYADTSALSALCASLVTQRQPVVLQRVPVTGPLIQAFQVAARGRGTLLLRPASAAPHVEFPRDFAAYESGLSARRRQDYRRARRRLEQGGPVTFDLRIPTPGSVSAELDEAMRVEAAGWKERRGSALASNAQLGRYFRELAARLAARGSLRICFLRAGGHAIAMQISIEHARRWWILKIGYDENWSDYSPGIQLMWDVVRHAGETGLEGIEMLGSAESWLSIWARESREYRTLVFYPHNLRGLAALAADVVDAALRRLRRNK